MNNKQNKLAFVIDDVPVEGRNIEVILKRADFDVRSFTSEDPAVAALKDTSPHVAVVHFEENPTRTVDFIRKLNSLDPTVCILYPTFYRGTNLHAKALAAGAYAVIRKPDLYDGKFTEQLEAAFEVSRDRKSAAAGKGRALVLMPFAKSLDELYRIAIKEPLEAQGYLCERLDEVFFIGNVVEKLFEKIQQSELIIADLSGQNPNVFYETGFADALKKPVILLANDATKIPFDVQGRRLIVYVDIDNLKKELEKMIKIVLTGAA